MANNWTLENLQDFVQASAELKVRVGQIIGNSAMMAMSEALQSLPDEAILTPAERTEAMTLLVEDELDGFTAQVLGTVPPREHKIPRELIRSIVQTARNRLIEATGHKCECEETAPTRCTQCQLQKLYDALWEPETEDKDGCAGEGETEKLE